ncbi:hypothetical protein J6590_035959 [Homalodisca vitripennis]|nr:hypothetical protein J6590_035959 [Homalodisca vitripennis]
MEGFAKAILATGVTNPRNSRKVDEKHQRTGLWEWESEVLAGLNKGVPPPACFDWRGWFRAGLPFFRGTRLVPQFFLMDLNMR